MKQQKNHPITLQALSQAADKIARSYFSGKQARLQRDGSDTKRVERKKIRPKYICREIDHTLPKQGSEPCTVRG